MPEQPHDASCIFCKIVAGQIPCHRVYENEQVLAFLDIEPLARGHTLVIPKAHYGRLEDMPPELAGACLVVVPALARAVLQATASPAWNLLQNNGKDAHQAVPHVHFHIIPRVAGAGLGLKWLPTKLDHDQAPQLIQAIKQGM